MVPPTRVFKLSVILYAFFLIRHFIEIFRINYGQYSQNRLYAQGNLTNLDFYCKFISDLKYNVSKLFSIVFC